MAKTLTLRLDQRDAELVEWAKEQTWHGTASKALLECVRRYQRQSEREAELVAEIERRRTRYEARQQDVMQAGRDLMRLGSLIAEECRTWAKKDAGQRELHLAKDEA